MRAGDCIEALMERSQVMRESLGKSQSITDNLIAVLGSFDHRLSDLEAAVRPTQVHTHTIQRAHENIDKTLKFAETILAQYETLHQVEIKINKVPHEDLGAYLDAVDKLRENIQFLIHNKSLKNNKGELTHANELLSKALIKLEDEFRDLLLTHSKVMDPAFLLENCPDAQQPLVGSSGSQPSEAGAGNTLSKDTKRENLSSRPFSLIPQRVIPQLHELAKRMISSDHHQQCMKTYRDIRLPVLEKTQQKLGVERITREDVLKMSWEMLEGKIVDWIRVIRISVKLLFCGERKICNDIFEGMDPYRDQLFASLISNSLSALLSFGEAVAKSKTSPEKLFVLLDMYMTMRSLMHEIDVTFDGKPLVEMRNATSGLTMRLAQAAQETFIDFEDNVEKDASKTVVLDGTVHPLTSYVINYVKFLYDYQNTLRQILGDDEDMDLPKSQLAQTIVCIMNALLRNLDGKSKYYRDAALIQIFLMNNIHYIVKSVRRTEAKEIFGTDWVQRHRRLVQQYATAYKRIAWSKILECLRVQGATGNSTGNDSTGVSKAVVKERFKSFNVQFEELHIRQSQWTVPDNELRDMMRLNVAEVLLPAYRFFLLKYGSMLDGIKHREKYIRYRAEDVERMLGEFFDGKSIRSDAR